MNERAISHRLTSLVLPIRASRFAARNPPRSADNAAMLETLSRICVELSSGVSGKPDGISETHFLLRRPVIHMIATQPATMPQALIVRSLMRTLRAEVTHGTGLTKSTATIPRHAQRLFNDTISPRSVFRNRLPQSPHPKRRLDGASARRGRPNRTSLLRSSRTVRRYQANGYLIATNAFWFSARPSMEQR
jgi:hypothetical protein